MSPRQDIGCCRSKFLRCTHKLTRHRIDKLARFASVDYG